MNNEYIIKSELKDTMENALIDYKETILKAIYISKKFESTMVFSKLKDLAMEDFELEFNYDNECLWWINKCLYKEIISIFFNERLYKVLNDKIINYVPRYEFMQYYFDCVDEVIRLHMTRSDIERGKKKLDENLEYKKGELNE